ncbi:MAG: desulfoferrodoxin [Clostridiaceae bacterium]|jgi:superoxide reductase|nr:desulfoferrodoxin [Clostridiaceae bacterium]
MSKEKFYRCDHCGNLVGMVNNAGVPMICCGQKMTELIPNTTDGAIEKHVPSVTVSGNTVKVQVGSVAHPMLPEHYITFVYLLTEKGGQRKALSSGEAPSAEFVLVGDKPVAVYEYCNIHGLWKKDI